MALIDVFVGRPPADYDPDSDPLAKPVPQETEDLPIHVELCARRYAGIMQAVTSNKQAAYDMRAFILRIGLFVIAALAGIMKGPDLLVQLLKVL